MVWLLSKTNMTIIRILTMKTTVNVATHLFLPSCLNRKRNKKIRYNVVSTKIVKFIIEDLIYFLERCAKSDLTFVLSYIDNKYPLQSVRIRFIARKFYKSTHVRKIKFSFKICDGYTWIQKYYLYYLNTTTDIVFYNTLQRVSTTAKLIIF